MMQVAATMELDGRHGYIERRADNRHISVFRVGRLACGGRDQLCVIRNISSGGAMIEANNMPGIGEHVRIDLRSDRCFMAVVRWVRQREIGVEFDEPIDVEAVLREERQSILRQQPRAPRFRRKGTARIVGAQGVSEGAITNISINGIAIQTPTVFAKDEPVIVSIDGLGAAHAFARWSANGETGLRLNTPLSYKALADWLDAHPEPITA